MNIDKITSQMKNYRSIGKHASLDLVMTDRGSKEHLGAVFIRKKKRRRQKTKLNN